MISHVIVIEIAAHIIDDESHVVKVYDNLDEKVCSQAHGNKILPITVLYVTKAGV